MKFAYRHVRHAYQAAKRSPHREWRRSRAAMLAGLVRRGDLVFDVGACRGDYTDVLLGFGCRVVAVEPNPALAETIRARYRVTVVQAAVGARPGSAELHLGRDPEHSTLSDNWLEAAPGRDRWDGATITVPVVTLDSLESRYGSPAFVKIDVEGYEAEVLRGAAQPPGALSFEYQSADLSSAEECVRLLPGYAFTVDGAWTDTAGVLRLLEEEADLNPGSSGDVYARHG